MIASPDPKSCDRTDSVRRIPVKKIAPHPLNPRKEFDEAELRSLADSLEAHGLLEPLIVRPASGRGLFELIAGERRLRAAALANWKDVPCIVRDVSDAEALTLQLIENLQRKDLNPIEEAHGLEQICRAVAEGGAGKTQYEAAEMIGKTQGHVSAMVRLLKLPDNWQQRIISRDVSYKKALYLCRYSDAPATLARIEQDMADNPWAYRSSADFERNAERVAAEAGAVATTRRKRTERPTSRLPESKLGAPNADDAALVVGYTLKPELGEETPPDPASPPVASLQELVAAVEALELVADVERVLSVAEARLAALRSPLAAAGEAAGKSPRAASLFALAIGIVTTSPARTWSPPAALLTWLPRRPRRARPAGDPLEVQRCQCFQSVPKLSAIFSRSR
jgi:ParB/RepB/Spo0J family partition protein